AEKYPELYRAWMEQPTEVTFPGGESFDIMERRVLSAAADLRLRHRGLVVAIVTHGGVNRVLLRDALDLPKASIFRLDQSYAALSLVDYYEHAPVVRFVNVELDKFDHRPEC
ncbi:MAG: histidine phosphatase family protein, partial [Vicinamibacteria bacterium]